MYVTNVKMLCCLFMFSFIEFESSLSVTAPRITENATHSFVFAKILVIFKLGTYTHINVYEYRLEKY